MIVDAQAADVTVYVAATTAVAAYATVAATS
jgi:hypothetical protein